MTCDATAWGARFGSDAAFMLGAMSGHACDESATVGVGWEGCSCEVSVIAVVDHDSTSTDRVLSSD